MSCGIAQAGQDWAQSDGPHPLPVQALDHATGYLLAAAALSALHNGARTGQSATARLSLARTAEALARMSCPSQTDLIGRAKETDYEETVEQTGWGPAYRLRGPLQVGETRLSWDIPAGPCGQDPAIWIS